MVELDPASPSPGLRARLSQWESEVSHDRSAIVVHSYAIGPLTQYTPIGGVNGVSIGGAIGRL